MNLPRDNASTKTFYARLSCSPIVVAAQTCTAMVVAASEPDMVLVARGIVHDNTHVLDDLRPSCHFHSILPLGRNPYLLRTNYAEK
jgi:hypothetical protein